MNPLRLIAIGLIAMLLLPWTTGCSNKLKKKTTTDPLLGEYDPNGQPLPPPPAPGAQTSNNVPPLPSAISADSNAAIAHGGPLSDTPSISISGPNGQLTSSNWKRSVSTPSGLNLEPSRPVVEPIPSDGSQAVPNINQGNVVPAGSWSSPAPAVKVDPWLAQLKSRGVIGHRRKVVPGGVEITAVIPNPQNPQNSKFTQMVTATAPDYDRAMQALVRQLDERK